MKTYDEIKIKIGKSTLSTENINDVSFWFSGEDYNYGETDEFSSETIQASEIKSKLESLNKKINDYDIKLLSLTRESVNNNEVIKLSAENHKLKATVVSLKLSISKLSEEAR